MLRLRASKTEAEEAGIETEGMATSVSKLRKEILALTKNKVDIMIDDSTFKSTYQIMKEISSVWNELNDVTRANLTNLIGGKRNANVISSLVMNFQDAENASKAAAESMGSAMKENEKYLDSIEGKISVLKATFQDLSRTVIDSDAVKFFVDMGTALLNVMNTLAKIKVLGPALTAMIIGLQSLKSRSEVTSVVGVFESMVTQGKSSADIMAMLSNNVRTFSDAQNRMLANMLQQNDAWGKFVEGASGGAEQITRLGNATAGATGKLQSFWSSFSNMSLVGKISLITSAITAVVGVVSAIRNHIQAAREAAIQAAQDVVDNYENAEATYNSNISKLESMRDRFEELSRGVDENGNNIRLTKSEYDEYKQIVQEIIDISPTVISGYNSEREALVEYNTVLSEAVEYQNKLFEAKRNSYYAGANDLLGKARSDMEYLAKNPPEAASNIADYFASLFVGGSAEGGTLDVIKARQSLQKIFEKIGIELETPVDFDPVMNTWVRDLIFNPDNLKALYDAKDEFLAAVTSDWVTDEIGIVPALVPPEDIEQLRSELNELAKLYVDYESAISPIVEMTQMWAKDQSWFENIPTDALGDFLNGLYKVIDINKTWTEIKNDVNNYANDIIAAWSTEDVVRLQEAGENLNPTQIEEYVNELDALRQQLLDLGYTQTLVDSIIDRLMNYTDTSSEAAVATYDLAESFEDLSSELKDLHDATAILNQAKSEMKSDGGLSFDTVQSIQNMLEDGESLADYLYVENGALQLNAEAWERRAYAASDKRLDELDAERESLEHQQHIIEQNREYYDALRRAAAGAMIDEFESEGNVNLLRRPVINAQELVEAGWEDAGRGAATLFTSTFTAGVSDAFDYKFDEDIVFNITPILPDGTKLSPDELSKYIEDLLHRATDSASLKEADLRENGGKNLLLGLFNVEDNDIDAAIQKAESKAERLHELQAQYYQEDILAIEKADVEETLALLEQIYKLAESEPEITPFRLSDLFGDLDEIQKEAQSFYSLYEEVLNGRKLSTAEFMRYAEEYDGLYDQIYGIPYTQDEILSQLRRQLYSYSNKYIAIIENARDYLAEGIDNGKGDGWRLQGFETIDQAKGMLGVVQDMYNAAIKSGGAIQVKVAEEVDDYTKLNEAISAVNKSAGLLNEIQSEDSNFLDMLSTAAEMAKDTGQQLSDFVSFDGTDWNWNTDAIKNYAAAYVDALDGIDGMSAEAQDALKALLVVEMETVSASEQIADSYNKTSSAISGMAAAASGAELTFKAYKELIDIDARYATAVEYQNGILTLNKDRYTEVTQAIAEETIAMAKQREEAILADQEYQDLISRIGSLSDDEQKHLDSLNAEIMGYRVLASEIRNTQTAYAAYQRASSNAHSEGYTAAQSAYEVIKNTRSNAESDIFGMYNREQYKEAVKFLISPDIEIDSEAGQAAWKKVERYMAEGTQGILNFMEDLESSPYFDTVNNRVVGSMQELANELGVSVPFLQQLFSELNQYMEVDISESGLEDVAEGASDLTSAFKGTADSASAISEKLSGVVDKAAEALQAATSAQTVKSEAETAQEELQKLIELANELNPATISLDIGAFSTSAGKISSGLDEILSKLKQIHQLSSVNVVIKTAMNTLGSVFSGIQSKIASRFSGTSGAAGLDDAPGGRTLVGEVGVETVIDPSANKWYTVGNKGPEFVNLPRGAIVLNAAQTSLLFKSGRDIRFGRAMANGNIGNINWDAVLTGAGIGANAVTAGGSQWNTTKNMLSGGSKKSTSKAATSYQQAAATATQANTALASSLDKLLEKYKELDAEVSHLIEHQEFLYKQAEHDNNYQGMLAALQEEANLTQRIIDKSQKTIEKMTKAGASDADAQLQEVEKTYWSAVESLNSLNDQIDQVAEQMRVQPFEDILEKYQSINDEMEHLIEHQKFLYEQAQRGLDYAGMEASLQEQATITRKIMNDAQDSIQKMLKAGAKDTDKQLQEIEKTYWSAYKSLASIMDQLGTVYVDGLNSKIDGIQSAYSTLSEAVDQFNEHGGISVDVFQAIASHGLQYLSVLEMLGSQYAINDEAVERLIQAETEQLAIEESLNYVHQLSEALLAGNSNLVDNLVNLTNQLSNATWDAVYAQAEMLLNLGLAADQYDTVLDNINKMKSLSTKTIKNLSYNFSGASSSASATASATKETAEYLDKILDYTKDLIKAETEEHIKAIEDEIDKYKELIEKKKESLRATQEEDSYAKEIATKTKEIAQLQARINQLSLDDSREARAERAKLEEELAGLQDELYETQDDHAYELQTDALDKMAEDYEAMRQIEIDALEESISSEEKLYRLAIDRIENRWATLYADLIEWNTRAGSVLNQEITENWEKATKAIEKYGSYAQALAAYLAGTFTLAGDSSSVKKVTTTSTTVSNYIPSNSGASSQWWAKYVTGGTVGTGSSSSSSSNIGGVAYKFHSGGAVGGALKDNEVMAVLEKGETVLSQTKKGTLYQIVDFFGELSKKIGTAVSSLASPVFNSMVPTALSNAQAVTAGGVGGFSPTLNITVNAEGTLDESSAGTVGSRLGEAAAAKLYEAFQRRGLGGTLSSKLK